MIKDINITFKSVLQPIKNIEERNQYFEELSDEGKRLEIAWDCLQLILANKIKASEGCYYWNHYLSKIRGKIDTSKEFQIELIKILPKDCKVCVRGGMMLSQIRLGNKISPKSDNVMEGSIDNIRGFTFNDFIIMEKEYEFSKYNHPYISSTSEKLANICCNILVNGNFNTEDKTDYLITE